MKKDRTLFHSRGVMRTATLVTSASAIERGLGFLYRIVLSRMIGAEGMGLYQIALSVFAVFLTIGTGGIPVTVSRLISKNKAGGGKENGEVFAGILLSLALTLPVCLLFLFFGNAFGFLFSDKRCLDIFAVLLVGLSFSAVYAVLRGGFWGDKNFLFPSITELAEEAVMVIVGILLLTGIHDPFIGAKRAAVAVVISYLVSFTLAAVGYFLPRGKPTLSRRVFRPLARSAMPITLVRASGSLLGSVVAILLPAMLIRTGLTKSEALALFGVVTGMVMPVLSVPSTFIGSLSLVLVPELAEDYYGKKYDRLSKNIGRGVFVATAIAAVIIPFFLVLGEDLGRLLFSSDVAGVMIRRSAFILLPMSLTMISTSILNSLGFEKRSLVYYFIGESLMICSVLFLPAKLGIYAYPVGMAAAFTTCALCNLLFLKKLRLLKRKLFKNCLLSLLFALPVLLIGMVIHPVFTRFFSAFVALLLSVAIMAATTFAVYFSFHKLSLRREKKYSAENNKRVPPTLDRIGKFV